MEQFAVFSGDVPVLWIVGEFKANLAAPVLAVPGLLYNFRGVVTKVESGPGGVPVWYMNHCVVTP